MRKSLAALAALALGACASAPYEMQSTWRSSDVVWASSKGDSKVMGSAVYVQASGATRTCAGLEVSLIPDSEYARERIQAELDIAGRSEFHKTANTGWPNPDIYYPANISAPEPGYIETSRRTVCDENGRFVFDNIPAGDYFLTSLVTWEGLSWGPATKGAFVSSPVTVKPGDVVDVVLSNQESTNRTADPH